MSLIEEQVNIYLAQPYSLPRQGKYDIRNFKGLYGIEGDFRPTLRLESTERFLEFTVFRFRMKDGTVDAYIDADRIAVVVENDDGVQVSLAPRPANDGKVIPLIQRMAGDASFRTFPLKREDTLFDYLAGLAVLYLRESVYDLIIKMMNVPTAMNSYHFYAYLCHLLFSRKEVNTLFKEEVTLPALKRHRKLLLRLGGHLFSKCFPLMSERTKIYRVKMEDRGFFYRDGENTAFSISLMTPRNMVVTPFVIFAKDRVAFKDRQIIFPYMEVTR